MGIKLISEKRAAGINHQIVKREDGRYAYIQWDGERGQVYSPNYGSGSHGGVFAAGCQDIAINYVAFWCARSTAYKRRREALYWE